MKEIVRTDLIAGLIVTALGLGATYESWRMPRFENRNADPLTLPGIAPGLLGIVLAILGLLLVLRALSGRKAELEPPITNWPAGSPLRTLLTVVLVGIYGVLLFGRIDFLWATTAFIFVFTLMAEWINPERKLSLPKVAAGALVLALVSSFALEFVFEKIFFIRLPG